MADGGPDTEEGQIDDTPAGQQRRWTLEFAAARKEVRKWHERGEAVIKRFLDERGNSEREGDKDTDTRLNLFTANVQTIRAIMYGKLPKVDATRRFNDSKDDVARVSAEMLERMLNEDIESDGDSFAEACGAALDDRLLPGLGVVRLRYEATVEEVEGQPSILHPQTGAELAPEVPATQKKTDECVETDYVYWKDALWSPARVWRDVRWVAFRTQMSRKKLTERFPEHGDAVPLNSKQGAESTDALKNTPWGRADVWEVWSKEEKKVYWVVEGYREALDVQEDPLGLEGFYPCPRPMMANVTTSRLVPTPDFALAQDLYDEMDRVSNRITILERAVIVRGAYDKSMGPELARLLQEAGQNELIPVSNWPLLAEKGGLAAVIAWVPLEPIVAALDKLREYRTELSQLIFQVTGMSDIVRGQAESSTTATEQSIKAKFASVRLQAFQDEFARFCSDTQRLKAEIISKHFDVQTILEASNMEGSQEAPELIQQAAQLIKSNHMAYRVEVKPESVSLTDYAALKQERTEVLQAIGGYMQMAMPIGMQMPQMAPMLMQLLQWLISGIRGSQEIEGILDAAIAQVQQAAQQPPPQQQQGPDPKLQAAQLKGQMDLQREHLKAQAGLAQIQAQSQADTMHQVQQTHFNIVEAQAKDRAKMLTGVDHALNPPGTTGGEG